MQTTPYLSYLHQNTMLLKQLYVYPPVLFSLYRSISHVARNLLLRINPMPIKQQSIILFAQSKEQIKHIQAAKNQLLRYCIIQRQSKKIDDEQAVYLSVVPTFKETLQYVFEKGPVKVLKQNSPREVPHKQWWGGYMKLYQLISQPSMMGSRSIQSKSIREVLKKSKLVSYDQLQISCQGFQFILNRLGNQITKLLKSYTFQILRLLPNSVKLIAFMLGLSILPINKWYDLCRPNGQPLLKEQMDIISDLTEIGFCSRKGDCVAITQLFSNFCFEQPKAKLDMQCDIIVQTNFRVYAQLSQSIQKGARFMRQLLKKFIKVEDYQFQNMIVGTITQQQIKMAFKKGITATNIIEFFRQNTNTKRFKQKQQQGQCVLNQIDRKGRLHFLHLDERDSESGIPVNVSQQIRLWQQVKWQTSHMQIQQSDSYF